LRLDALRERDRAVVEHDGDAGLVFRECRRREPDVDLAANTADHRLHELQVILLVADDLRVHRQERGNFALHAAAHELVEENTLCVRGREVLVRDDFRADLRRHRQHPKRRESGER
jgi:hypothetical protein